MPVLKIICKIRKKNNKYNYTTKFITSGKTLLTQSCLLPAVILMLSLRSRLILKTNRDDRSEDEG